MKFVISAAQRAALMTRLDEHLRADANADDSAYYPIVSLYYDNAERDCYWEKVQSLKSRRKLRVRVYGSLDGKLPPTCFMEIKHKQEGRGVKRRIQLPLEQALRVGQGLWLEGVNLSPVDKRAVEEVHDLYNRRGFRPCLVMRYDRRAYAARDPKSDLRITYDTGIAYRLTNLNPIPDDRDFAPENYLHPEGTSVLEVKITGTIPYWLSIMIAETGCILQSHSKYSKALERSDPVLRAMLAPSWRNQIPGKPLPVSGNAELDEVSPEARGELLSGIAT